MTIPKSMSFSTLRKIKSEEIRTGMKVEHVDNDDVIQPGELMEVSILKDVNYNSKEKSRY